MNGVVRAALVLGLIIDAAVGLIALFAPALSEPLFDIPLHDPALAAIAGGEFIVVAGVYALVLRDMRRFAPFLWLLALDQAFAVAVPAIEIAGGHLAATVKTVGPLPISAALAVVLAYAARRNT